METENRDEAAATFNFNWMGALAMVIGAWWLLGELDIVAFNWGIVAPLALILWGAGMVFGRDAWC